MLFQSIKKNIFFQKIDKNVQFNSLFLGIPNNFLCPRKAGCFFYLRTEKVVCLKHCLFTVSALDMRERAAYRKQMRSNVSALLSKVSTLEHDRFIHCYCYGTLSHYSLQILEPKLQTPLLAWWIKYLQFCFTVSMI